MVQYAERLDTAFAALADSTRRGIVERLAGEMLPSATWPPTFDMTLTGIKKHVQVLESAGLVSSAKVGRYASAAWAAAGWRMK